ncbi:MAG TPA: 4Fe-4S binding protein [Bacillota bacterium]|nr:4Fe-4S binding protein [Clostridiales bacterium]HOQ13758.1 4Fe-4S binding protein [Bacillota bacterium]
MAHIINKEKCIGCGSCEAECPVGAISADEDGKYVIDADKCIDCGACASVCPVEAPEPKED